jgi:hypothetical protein
VILNVLDNCSSTITGACHMAIEEQIAELLYSLNEIETQTDDPRIRVMAEAMEVTVMELDNLVYRAERDPLRPLN